MRSAEPAREQAERPTAAPEAAPAGAPQRLLDLQRTAGNRAVGRLLARQTPTDVEVKKRFDLPVHSYSQDQVRALYLGIGIVYSGDAVWDAKSAPWIVDRGNVISMPGIGRGGGGDDVPSRASCARAA